MKMDKEKLTAYALDELEGEERERVEQYMEQDEEARDYVEGIRETAGLITEELKRENEPGLGSEQRSKIVAASGGLDSIDSGKKPRSLLRRLVIPVAAAVVLLAAASLFVPTLLQSEKEAEEVGPFTYSLFGELPAQDQGIASRESIARVRNMPTEQTPNFGMKGDLSVLAEVPVIVEEIFEEEELDLDDDGLIDGVQDVPTEFNTEQYDRIKENPFLKTVQNPLSTFSIDVDTASYSNMRRYIRSGLLPPKDAVRIEELINYFTYDYPQPEGDHPFSVNVEIAGCPWNLEHRLARVGLKGREIKPETRPAANIVFLLDVSGSMNSDNKLGLVKEAMKMLTERLEEKDLISIAVYAGASGLVLPATSCREKGKIISAFDRLKAGGSTNGGAGIELAYQTAVGNFIEGGINRVILCTDGDFNVGITDNGSLVDLIEKKAKSGVFLSVLGFGMGNYKDSRMEQLADKGNGNYAYIDTGEEAKKVLCDQLSGTLVTIAKDVKIQIEFNPAKVSAYRLIGYENRMLAKEDFNDDTKDAGEIGAGHTVTALYELVPFGMEIDTPDVDPLRYEKPAEAEEGSASSESFFLKLRYKAPDGDTSKLLAEPVQDFGTDYTSATGDFKFAASVAAFGMILRDSEYVGTATIDTVLELGDEGVGPDEAGYRKAFIELAKRAKRILAQK